MLAAIYLVAVVVPLGLLAAWFGPLKSHSRIGEARLARSPRSRPTAMRTRRRDFFGDRPVAAPAARPPQAAAPEPQATPRRPLPSPAAALLADAPAGRLVALSAATRSCPDCAETVTASAATCRFCGYELGGGQLAV